MSRKPNIGGLPSPPPIISTGEFQSWTTEEARTRGEFRAEAIWLPLRENSSNETEDAASDGDNLLDEILAAIVSDVMAKAAGARSAIMAEYGGKIAFARKLLPRQQVAGAVQAFKAAQAAALAIVAKEAATEMAARREAAIRKYSRRSRVRKASIWGGPPGRPTPK